MYRYDAPVNNEPLTLFEFSVRKVITVNFFQQIAFVVCNLNDVAFCIFCSK